MKIVDNPASTALVQCFSGDMFLSHQARTDMDFADFLRTWAWTPGHFHRAVPTSSTIPSNISVGPVEGPWSRNRYQWSQLFRNPARDATYYGHDVESVDINREILALITNTRQLDDDETEEEFLRGLEETICRYRGSAIASLQRILLGSGINKTVAWEALAYLGAVKGAATHVSRRNLLERSLEHPSSLVRDGALVGLANLGDEHAIPHIQQAVRIEKNGRLRSEMERILTLLKSSP